MRGQVTGQGSGGLSTTDKQTLIDIGNEAAANDITLKTSMVSALTTKGITADTSEPWSSLISKISTIVSTSINSIQRGQSSISGTSTTVTLTSAVDLTKAIVFLDNPNGYSNMDTSITVKFLSATQIVFQKTGSGSLTVNWQVVEYNGVKSLQWNEYTGQGTKTTTITSVDPAKSILYCSFRHNVNGTAAQCTARIVNGTTLEFAGLVNVSTYNTTVSYFVVEFN